MHVRLWEIFCKVVPRHRIYSRPPGQSIAPY